MARVLHFPKWESLSTHLGKGQMNTFRIITLILLFGTLSGPVSGAKSGQSELELRQPNTPNNTISAQVGETVEVEVFIRGRGEQITGVQIFFSFDDTYLELVSQGSSQNGPRPFIPGGYIDGSVFRNDSMDDAIGNSSINKLPLYQMLYQEQISGGFGSHVFRAGDGTIARFSLRVIRKPQTGSVRVVVDASSPIGSQSGYFIVSDPGTTYTFQNIKNVTFNVQGVDLDVRLPDLFLLPAEVNKTLDLDDFIDDPASPDSTITWTASAPNPAGVTVSIDPTTHVVTANAQSFIGVTEVVFTAATTLQDTLRDTINVIVDTPPTWDEAAIPDTIRFVEDGTDSSLVLVASDLDDPLGGTLVFDSPDTATSIVASIATGSGNSRRVTFTTTPHFSGEELRTFTVRDEFGLADTTQVLVIVDGENDPPEFFEPFPTVTVGGQGQAVLTMTDFVRDVDDPFNGLQFSFSGSDSVAFDVSSGNTRMTITPVPPFMGTRTVLVVVQDTSDATDAQNIVVQVQPPDDPQAPQVLVPFLKMDVIAGSSRTEANLDTLVTDIDTPVTQLNWRIPALSLTNADATQLSNSRVLSLGAAASAVGFEPATLTVSDPLSLTDTLAVRIYSASPITGDPVTGGMPDLVIPAGEIDSLDLNDFYFDATDSDEQMRWSATGQVGVSVQIDPDTRIARFVAPSVVRDPTEEIVLEVRDPDENTATDTITVTVIPAGGVLVDTDVLGGTRTIIVGQPDTLALTPNLIVGDSTNIVWSAESEESSVVLAQIIGRTSLQLIGLVEGDIGVEITATDTSSDSSTTATLTVRSRRSIAEAIQLRDIGPLVLTANRDTTIDLAALVISGNTQNIVFSTPGHANIAVEIDSTNQVATLRPVTGFLGDAGSLVIQAEDIVTGGAGLSLATPVTVQGSSTGGRELIEVRLLVNPIRKNFLDAYVISRRTLLTDPTLGILREGDATRQNLNVSQVAELTDTWVGDVTIGDAVTGTVQVFVTGITEETRIALTDTVRLDIAEGGISEQFTVSNENVLVQIPSGGLSSQAHIALFEGAALPGQTRTKAVVDELRQVSPTYRVHGTRGELVSPGRVRFLQEAEPGAGVYRRQGSEWVYVSEASTEGTSHGVLDQFGSYAVFVDRSAPAMGEPTASDDGRSVLFEVTERGSGIDGQQLMLVADGRPQVATYVPDAGIVWSPVGSFDDIATVELVVVDLAGNEAVWNGDVSLATLIRRPTKLALHQNFPNPFNPQTIIKFDLPSDGSVQIDVYNLLGQRVRRLVEAPHGAGRHSVAWDARDDQGHRVAAGVYLYRLTANSGVRVRKMLLLK